MFIPATLCFAEDAGTARVAVNATFGGMEITPGVYTFQAIQEANGSFIQISKGDQVIATGRAIVIPARKTVEKPEVQIVQPAGRKFVRIRIRSGDNWYFAYMQVK